MVCNVSRIGRIGRLIIGGILVAWAIGQGPTWTWGGLVIMATGAWRFCPLLWMLGIRKVDDGGKPIAPAPRQ
ncbi:MAG: DUF2892 domain-containing protein [Bdellovibrionaceae bacterium]|nr:DUF2892 domain-containing protein [Pseudobdellovibrionaceae bacterium]